MRPSGCVGHQGNPLYKKGKDDILAYRILTFFLVFFMVFISCIEIVSYDIISLDVSHFLINYEVLFNIKIFPS